MKAIILVAGRGMRIRANHDLPKCFLEINNERVLTRTLRFLKESGVDDVILVTGYKEELIKSEYPGYKYVTNPFYQATNTLASLVLGMTGQDFSEDIIVINGDTVFEKDCIDQMVNLNGNVFAVKEVKPTMEEVKVRIKDNKIINIGKWLITNTEAIGVYKLTPEFARDFYETASIMSDFKSNYYEDAFDKIIRDYDVVSLYTKAEEIDTWEDYNVAKQNFE